MNINDIVIEGFFSFPEKLTRRHVGAGYGKIIGGAALGIPGMIAGKYVGGKVVGHPDAPIDPSKRSHRVGALIDRSISSRTVGAGLAGGAAGAALGAVADNSSGHLASTGGIAGAVLGHAVMGAHDRWKTAKKLGYGGFGKTMAATNGAITGLFKPKHVPSN